MNTLSQEIHENAVSHGWWEEERGFPEVLALCHSELSEALEEYRDGKPPIYAITNCQACNDEAYTCDEIKDTFNCIQAKPEGVAVELADCIIRILDYCGHADIDIETAIRAKMEYNKTRPYRHGGKKC